MKTRPQLLRRAACCLALVLAAASAHAATVRGQLLHSNGYPAAGYAVTVSSAQTGRSSPARVGADGMYYILNVPPGAYYLEIWVNPQSPMVYQIYVNEPYTDIPRIVIP